MTKRLLLVLATLLIYSASKAQDLDETKVKLDVSDELLTLVLVDLELKYRLDFEYNPEELKGIRVSCESRKIPLRIALGILLQNTGVHFIEEEKGKIKVYKGAAPPKIVRHAQSQQYEETRHRQKDVNVSGRIVDGNTGESLPFANVSVAGSSQGVSSNVDGYFTLMHVPTDTTTLLINYLGYATTAYKLHPKMDLEFLDIRLLESNIELQEVIVQASSEEQILDASTGISSIGITPDAVSTLPSYGEKDVFRSLQLLPGVSGSNESSSGLYVRGGTPDQNLVLFDGFTVYHVDHLYGFFSAFNAQAIKDIQLHKGGFEPKFGGRISSVVELTGKDGNTEAFNASAGISLLSYNAHIESPFADGKGSMLIAARRSFQSNFYQNIADSFTGIGGTNNNQEGTPPGGFRGFGQAEAQPNSYFYDLNAKLTYRLSKKDIFSLSFYNGQDDLDNSRNLDNNSFGGFRGGGGGNNFDFQSNNTDISDWGNVGASVKWSRRWSDRFYTNTGISYSNYFSTRDRRNSTTVSRADTLTTRTTGTYENNDLKDFTIKIDNEYIISNNHQLSLGLQSTLNEIDYIFQQNDTLTLLNRSESAQTSSLYLQDQLTIRDQLILKGGLRANYYDLNKKTYIEPRLSATWLLSEQIKIKGAYGQYHQFANRVVREDIQLGSRDFWILSDDETVPVTKSNHYILGAAYENKDFLIDIEAYKKDLFGLSEYSTRLTPSGFGPGRTLEYEEFFFTGDGVAKGIEFLLQKKRGKFTGWMGYTLSEVLYDFEAFGEEPFYANQDQTHELKLVGSYSMGRWDFSGAFIYATGKPNTAPTGYYELPLIDGNTESYFEVSTKNGLRLPDYHRLDLSATYNFYLGNSRASLGMSLINLYNRENVWYKEYEVIEGNLFVTDVSLIKLTPSLFLKWNLR